MAAPDTVLLDCAPCGHSIAVPVLFVDVNNEIHVDHDWLKAHAQRHTDDTAGGD